MVLPSNAFIRYFFGLVITFACLTADLHADHPPDGAQKTKPALTVGLYPLLSKNMMQFRNQPLADFLQRTETANVQLKYLNSYQSFLSQGLVAKHDVIVAPSHFAMLFSQYKPLLLLDFELTALIVSLRSGAVHHTGQLPDKTLAIANKIALVSLVGLDHLEQQDVAIDTISLLKKSTHDRALHALFTGHADAAIISNSFFLNLPKKTSAKLRIIYQS